MIPLWHPSTWKAERWSAPFPCRSGGSGGQIWDRLAQNKRQTAWWLMPAIPLEGPHSTPKLKQGCCKFKATQIYIVFSRANLGLLTAWELVSKCRNFKKHKLYYWSSTQLFVCVSGQITLCPVPHLELILSEYACFLQSKCHLNLTNSGLLS